MAATTKNRKHAGRGTNQTHAPNKFDPVAKATTEYRQGTMVGIDTDAPGRPAVEMSNDLTHEIRGIAQDYVDNSDGAQGDKRVPLLAETAKMENDTAGNALTAAHEMGPCFALDNQTVANNDKGHTLPVAGVCLGVDDDGKPIVWPNPVIAKLWDALRPFQSAELTGTGASQDVAHGLGVIPRTVIVEPTDLSPATVGQYVVTKGAHDATNCKVTVTTGKKFRVYAWR